MNIKFTKCEIETKILRVSIKKRREERGRKEQNVSVIRDDIRKIPDLLVQLMTANTSVIKC